ncbi:MAG: hypothetical protein JRH08_08175 [Deltaproteobacteria bacterium]|nr:hypothetical protein [Deltaproteobacteria bacterium]
MTLRARAIERSGRENKNEQLGILHHRNNLSEYRDWSEKLHAEHFETANNLRKETSELCRSFDVRISRHDVDIHSIQKSLGKLEALLQQIVQNSAKTKGIALGLGMAGGAIVSILTLLAEIIK